MKIRDITINDIKEKALWKVTNSNAQNWLDWQIQRVTRISSANIIVHSSIIIDDQAAYPAIVTKYYEDGGEIGESGINCGSWMDIGEVAFQGSISRPFLSYISKLDIHEYQKGVFDNRNWHYSRFNHYISQLENENIIKYIEPDIEIPKYVINGTAEGNYSVIAKMVAEFDEFNRANKISKANMKITKIIKIIPFLKQNPKNHAMLESLLFSSNSAVVQMMQYQLVDLFEETCLDLITQKAKEDSLDGLGAKFWLKDYESRR
ncbi:hypothetical protein SRRS_45450 [Sporomusa rhizae]|uniref:hypothetical protein n=1 Tax=Sporomusa rhizae TaxID=357999 RepID=UPI00352AFF4D